MMNDESENQLKEMLFMCIIDRLSEHKQCDISRKLFSHKGTNLDPTRLEQSRVLMTLQSKNGDLQCDIGIKGNSTVGYPQKKGWAKTKIIEGNIFDEESFDVMIDKVVERLINFQINK